MCREDWRRQVPGGGGNFKALGCVTLNFKFFVSLWLQFFSTSPLQLTLIRKTYTHRCLEEVACVCVCVCVCVFAHELAEEGVEFHIRFKVIQTS